MFGPLPYFTALASDASAPFTAAFIRPANVRLRFSYFCSCVEVISLSAVVPQVDLKLKKNKEKPDRGIARG